MSNGGLGQYHFFAYARRGLVASLTPATPPALRPQLSVSLTVNAYSNSTATSQQAGPANIFLYGPADVVGVDPRIHIKTEPLHQTATFEPNYFAGIEFDPPDFPWMFTTATPDGDHLLPWVSLIVLKDDEFATPKDPGGPLPVIEVTALGALPDLSESWAWAHAQVTGDVPGDDLQALLANSPGRVLSRLLCPRQLDADTSYTAFLVPAFEAGRLAGLGMNTSGVTTLTPAWPPSSGTILRLPVYYQFAFYTSARGDFESLVRLLKPRVLPPEVGLRLLDVSDPGMGFPQTPGLALGLGGALRSPQTTDTVWPDVAKTTFQTQLQGILNLTTPLTDDPDNPQPDDPAVSSPIYGRWHAGVQAVDRTRPGWVNDLSLDPRTRSAAGLGTQVIHTHLAAFMASAWRQLEGILQANHITQRAKLARAAMVQMYTKHFKSAANETLLTLTAAVHSKVRASPQTVWAAIATSRLPVRALSAAFRRIIRPLGQVRRGQGGVTGPPPGILSRLSSGEVTLAPPVPAPGDMVSVDQISDTFFPSWLPSWPRPLFAHAFWIVLGLALLLAAIAVVLGVLLSLVAFAVAIAAAILAAAVALAPAMRRLARSWTVAEDVRFEKVSPATVRGIPPRPGFQIVPPGQHLPPPLSGPPVDSPAARSFRAAASTLAAAFEAPQPDPAPPPAADIPGLSQTVLAQINPEVTVPARVRALVDTGSLRWTPTDPLDEIMAYPVIDDPMYEPLRDLSQDFLLPGLKLVPPDTIALLVTNEVFVEAYFVGLNQEIMRQLLWEGFPTDQRGSPFRQFWDVRSYIARPGDPTDPAQLKEQLRDIKPIHTWPRANLLGQNQNRPEMMAEKLVLLIRGELLRRYPDAHIYAVRAEWNDGTHPHELGTTERHPLCRGTLSPDVTFVVFDLTEDDVRSGDRSKGQGAGWFFVLQQNPSAPRFGLEPTPALDVVNDWADLSWGNFAFTPRTPGDPIFASPAIQPTGVNIVVGQDNQNDDRNSWGKDSAQTAYISMRRPVRLVVHADLMLPPRNT